MTPGEFRSRCPTLVHFSPQVRLDLGLLTASQVLDRNADERGSVWARFPGELEYRAFPTDHWKSHSRFRRRAGEAGSNLLVRDATDATRCFVLGSNFPLGDGTCIGTTLPLTDNRPGDPPPLREDWFRLLNRMFWVFPEDGVNSGFVNRLRLAASTGVVYRVRLNTRSLPDALIQDRILLSSINGGGSNGAFPRGTATYKAVAEWSASAWPPKEIGIRDGIPRVLCDQLQAEGGLSVDVANVPTGTTR